jgi:ecotin
MKFVTAIILACICLVTIGAAGDNMKAFPPADQGMTRYVLTVPQETDESALKIELVIGKTVQLDPRNRYFFGGKLETRTAKGWGFNYYVLPKLGQMAGTRMAADPNEPKVDRFITLGGEQPLLRYNSKLPVVVYVPEGVEVRYRIWRAAAETTKLSPG